MESRSVGVAAVWTLCSWNWQPDSHLAAIAEGGLSMGLGVADELKRMSYRDSLNRDQSLSQGLGFDLGQWLEDARTTLAECRTLVMELRADHATEKAVIDEMTAWAETLGAKLNADAGVTDTDYDAVITADAPATLTAGDPSAPPSSLA